MGVRDDGEHLDGSSRKKIAILMESDYYEHEIWYRHHRFLEEGIDARFVSKLWASRR